MLDLDVGFLASPQLLLDRLTNKKTDIFVQVVLWSTLSYSMSPYLASL